MKLRILGLFFLGINYSNTLAMQMMPQQSIVSSSSTLAPPSAQENLFILGPLHEMEKARVAAKDSDEFRAQEKQFDSYKITKPEEFFPLLRKTLHEQPIDLYLKKLQHLCTLLYYQALFMQDFENYLYMDRYAVQMINKTQDYLRNYATTQEVMINNFKLPVPNFKTASAYNLFLYYMTFLIDLTHQDFYTFLKKYLRSSNKEVVDFAQYSMQVYNNVFHQKDITKIRNEFGINFINFKSKLIYDQLQMPYEPEVANFIVDNLWFLIECRNWVAGYLKEAEAIKKKHGIAYFEEQDPERVEKIYQPQLIKIVCLYAVTHDWYEQLYALVRQELDRVVKEQVIKGITAALSTMSFSFVLQTTPGWNIPRSLPLRLPVFKLGHQNYNLITFERALAQEKIEKKKQKKKSKKPTATLSAAALAGVTVEEKPEFTEIKTEPKVLKKGDDGSYILENGITDENITIINPKNGTQEVLFKTKPTITKLMVPHYTLNVKQWFENPDQAIIAQGYTNQRSRKFTAPNRYWYPKALHSFSLLVDTYIQEYGNQTTIPSRSVLNKSDILITIPGALYYADGTEEMGVFAYIIDSENNQWYHRMFTPMKGQKLIGDLFNKGYFAPDMTGYYDIAFPVLPKKP